jgi:putative addiction module component (TIGR02574 family)
MKESNQIIKNALELPPAEKAQLIDRLLSSLDQPDREIDELWAEEVENRIDAYDKGKIRALSIKEVIEKYR